MTTIVTRAGKGAPLTHLEVDTNFTNLNTDKAETAGPTFTGVVKIATGAAATPSLAFTGDLNTGIYSPGADQLAISTGGTGRLFVDASGNVGVKTGSPFSYGVAAANLANLQIEASQFGALTLGSTAGGTGQKYWRMIGRGNLLQIQSLNDTGGAEATAIQINKGTAEDISNIQLFAGGNIRATITGTGAASGASATPTSLTLDNTYKTGSASWDALKINLYKSATEAYGFGVGASADLHYFAGDASGGVHAFYTSRTERLRITSTGTVNIVGAGTAGSTQAVSFNGSAPVNSLVIDSSGRVGVGTSSPVGKLNVAGYSSTDVAQDIQITRSSSGTGIQTGPNLTLSTGTATDTIALQGTQGRFGIWNYASSSWVERFCVTGPGNVGIGTNAPSTTLDCRGVISTNDALYCYNSARDGLGIWYNPGGAGVNQLTARVNGGDRLTIDGSGRVGVGTSPSTALHVIAADTELRVQSTTSTNGFVRFLNTSGSMSIGMSGAATNTLLIYDRTNSQSVYLYEGGASGYHVWYQNGTERARIDSSGRLLVGTSTARSNFFNTSWTPRLQIEGTSDTTSTQALICNSSDIYSSSIQFAKSRGATIGSNTVVQANDYLGSIGFQGSDGTEFVSGASIEAFVDGTPGANDMPGRLVFSTTADGASSPTARMTIKSDGTVGIGVDAPLGILHVAKTGGSTTPNLVIVSGGVGDPSSVDPSIQFGASGAESVGTTKIMSTGAYNARALAFHTGTDAAGTERLRITSTGRVGIGTGSPGVKVDVVSDNNTSLASVFRVNSNNVAVNTSLAYDGLIGSGQLTVQAGTSSALIFGSNSTERARIDSSGRLLVGTSSSSSSAKFVVQGSSSDSTYGGIIGLKKSVAPASGDHFGFVNYVDNGDNTVAQIYASRDGGTWTAGSSLPSRLVFSTTADGASSPTERMRIGSNGQIDFGNTTDGAYTVTRNTGIVAYFDRRGTDGTIIQFEQDGASEGTISVSGTTVSYNGAHLSRWSQLPGGATREEILRGTVLSNIDEMCEWGEEDNEQLNRMQVSDVEGDPNVSGVFQAWDDDDDTYADDFYCAMTGDFIIRIAAGIPVHRGQLLMSAGDGTAIPQDDDIVRSKTIAKVTSNHVTCTYDDGSYCVPCVLMAC